MSDYSQPPWANDPAQPRAEPPAVQPSMPVVPGFAPDDPLVLSAGVQSEKRVGRWEIPGWIRLSTELGSITLNCLEAHTRFQVIDVHVTVGLGSAVLIVPDGWAANVDRLGKGIGGVTNKVSPDPAAGCPLLVFRGSVGAGSFKIRYANRLDRWLLKRRQDRHGRAALPAGGDLR